MLEKNEQYSNFSFLDFLKHLSEIVSKSDSLELILDNTINLIKNVMNIERCSILIRDGNYLRIGASSGVPKEEWSAVKIPLGKGISGKVAYDNKPVVCEDITKFNGQTINHKKDESKYSTNSFISVPLIFKNKNLGVINITNPINRAEFDEDDLAILLALANFIAPYIENSRLSIENSVMRGHLANIIDSLPIGVITANDDLKILQCNSIAIRLLNMNLAKDGEHKLLKDAMPKETAETFLMIISAFLSGNSINMRELFLKNYISGEMTPVNISITRLRCGECLSEKEFVIVLEDLSLKKEINELLRINEMKNNFVSMVSHELKTPLTSIKGSIHILASSMPEGVSDSARDLVKIIASNTERLIKLVRDLIDVSNIENQTLSLMKRSGDLKQILLESIATQAEKFEKKNLEIIFDYSSPIREVAMDSERIKTVILDLLDNAYKFTGRGGNIFLKVWGEEDKIKISVRDTGIGIGKDQLDKIFDKFYQIDNSITRSVGGTGLGLYLARTLVRLHGGDIIVNPEYEGGAEFIVMLPIIADEEKAARIIVEKPKKTNNALEEKKQ